MRCAELRTMPSTIWSACEPTGPLRGVASEGAELARMDAADLQRHLEDRYRGLLRDGNICAIYDLR